MSQGLWEGKGSQKKIQWELATTKMPDRNALTLYWGSLMSACEREKEGEGVERVRKKLFLCLLLSRCLLLPTVGKWGEHVKLSL